MTESIPKGAFEIASVGPEVLAFLFWFAVSIIARIKVTIRKDFFSMSIFEPIEELSFVLVTIDPDVGSSAMWLAFLPISFVGTLTIVSTPSAFAMLEAVEPLAFIGLSVWPSVSSPTFRLSVDICPIVCRFRLEDFKASTVLAIILELALKATS
jgi:hypothetical protein